jgi:hypothetical protein
MPSPTLSRILSEPSLSHPFTTAIRLSFTALTPRIYPVDYHVAVLYSLILERATDLDDGSSLSLSLSLSPPYVDLSCVPQFSQSFCI